MEKLKLYTTSSLLKLVQHRDGEIKFGQRVATLTNPQDIYEQLKNLDVKYVLFGIPEDIGVFANYGKRGAYDGFCSIIKALLNTQHNWFNNANKMAVLGFFDFSKEQAVLAGLNKNKISDIKSARKIVEEIDKQVSFLIYEIVRAKKIPIAVGGGHNNAYGMIKGSSMALNKKVNVLNFDAHIDFRKEEGRHSGNGFSYAFTEGFLNKYFVFGLHENYTSQVVLNKIKKLNKYVKYNTFEALEIRKELKYDEEIDRALKIVSNRKFGLEIDCDAIMGIGSSAMTPSGIQPNKIRRLVHKVASHKNVQYLHISEAAPNIDSKKRALQTAKMVAYLITDFIRANS